MVVRIVERAWVDWVGCLVRVKTIGSIACWFYVVSVLFLFAAVRLFGFDIFAAHTDGFCFDQGF